MEREGEDIYKYSKKYECRILDNLDYLITPSTIYFENLKMEKYYNKIINIFYCLNKDWYIVIDINNYKNRKNNIILSGCVGGGYIGRIKYKNFKNLNKEFDNLIYVLEKNDNVVNMDYYSKLSEFKGAFVCHYSYPLNFLLAKHIEVLFCGCLGFFENNILLEKQLGLIAFKHYIPCSDDNGNIINDIEYYKKYLNSEEGEIIAMEGCLYVREKFDSLNYIKNYINFFNSI